MARTTIQHVDFYADGYNLTGYGRTVGPLVWEFEEVELTAGMGDAVKGYLPGGCTIGGLTYNVVLEDTATVGSHARLSVPGGEDVVMIPFGMQAAVAIGDPVYVGQFERLSYHAVEEGKAVMANAVYGAVDPDAVMLYNKPWGLMAHELAAETAANAGTTDSVDNAVQTTAGGYIVWQVTAAGGAGAMTAEIKLQHSNTNVNLDFVDLAGATSGVIDCVGGGVSGIAQCAIGATVERYTRWQLDLTLANSVTFALAFVRGQ